MAKNHCFGSHTAITHNNPRNLLYTHDRQNAAQRAKIRLSVASGLDVHHGIDFTDADRCPEC